MRGLRTAGSVVAALLAATLSAAPARASATAVPGMLIKNQDWACTAGFAARDADRNYYLFTSGHCDHPVGAQWTDSQGAALGHITVSEDEGDQKDAALILLDREVGTPVTAVGGAPLRDVLVPSALHAGLPICKLGAITGETCGTITSVEDRLVITSVPAQPGDSGSAGYVKNSDGTVSAVGVLSGTLGDDVNTTVFFLVQPLLHKWGLSLIR